MRPDAGGAPWAAARVTSAYRPDGYDWPGAAIAGVVVGMSSQGFSNLINIVLVVATFAVVVFAWRTVREAKKTTAEERKTVAQLQALVQTAKETAASSASTMQAAKETARISRATLDAAQRYRQREQLHRIQLLVDDIRRVANSNAVTEHRDPMAPPNWQSPKQFELGRALVGAGHDLPKCRALANAHGVTEVTSAVAYANNELDDVFQDLDTEDG